MGADGAVDAVVQDQDDRLRIGLERRGKLGAVHLEIAVPGEADDRTSGLGHLGGDGGGKAISHRPGLRREQPRPGAVFEEPPRPDREVARAVGDDGVLRQPVAQEGADLAHVDRRRLVGQVEARLVGGAALGPPGGPVAPDRLKRAQRRGEGIRSGLDPEVRAIDLADLQIRAVDMDQPLLRLRQVEQRVAVGRVLAEAVVDGEDQVGLADQLPDRGEHADARLAAEGGRGIVVHVLVAEDRDHRNVRGLGEPLDRQRPLPLPVAAAIEDQRALRPGKHVPQPRHRRRRGLRFVDLHGAGQRRGVGGRSQHVLGQCHDHRAGAAGDRGDPGTGDDLRDAFDAVDLDRPFRHRAEHRPVIDLLERLAALHVGADLADEQDHRRAVLHRRMHADRGIGRTRTAGDHADAGLSRQFSIGGRHEPGAAFVAAHDVVELSFGVEKRVQHRKVAFARHPEGLARTKGHEALDQKLSTVPHHLNPSLPVRSCSGAGRAGRRAQEIRKTARFTRAALPQALARKVRRNWPFRALQFDHIFAPSPSDSPGAVGARRRHDAVRRIRGDRP